MGVISVGITLLPPLIKRESGGARPRPLFVIASATVKEGIPSRLVIRNYGEESLLSSLPWRERVRRVLSEVERVGGRNSSQSYNRKSTVQASDEYPITLSVSLPLP